MACSPLNYGSKLLSMGMDQNLVPLVKIKIAGSYGYESP